MKKIILSIAFTVLFMFLGVAQNITIGMKTGMLNSKVKFDWREPITNNAYLKIRPCYALFMEGKLYDFIYLGAEMGTCSYSIFMDFKYNRDGNTFGDPKSQTNYLGWYQQEQFYFTINPQLKFGKSKWLSIGGGLGLFNNYINRFSNGFRTIKYEGKINSDVLYLEGMDMYAPNTVKGGFFNIALNPKINKHLGLLVESRYTINSASNGQTTKVKPDISFNSFSVMAGLSFHF